MRARGAVVLLLAIVAAACSSAGTTSAGPSVAPLEPYVPPNSGPVAEVTVEGVLAHLEALQAIADQHGGTRVAGSTGYDASVAYVAGVLEATGYDVERLPVSVPVFEQRGPSVLERTGSRARTWVDGRDFRAMLFSASGDVRARVSAADGSGCSPEDFATFPVGDIALVEPGDCFRRQQVVNAQDAGAAAVIGVTSAARGRPLRPTLVFPGGIRVPVVSVTAALGAALGGATVHVRVRAATSFADADSIVAEPAGAESSDVVMLGGHLDSVLDGPGINDNGSGTALLLEVARWLAGQDPIPAVRFAFWAGEEEGLYGSWDYAHALSSSERAAIDVYLNLDMVASPNHVTFVYEASAGDPPMNERVADLFERALDELGASSEPLDLHGSSDHAAFEDVGIATGGLYSGSQEVKSPGQAEAFGGAAGEPLDACYHQACDTLDNIGELALETHLRALVAVVTALLLG
ncbi:MAG: M20/M25/M40 family metallo-hydrolase [Actinomycetota bacterium]